MAVTDVPPPPPTLASSRRGELASERCDRGARAAQALQRRATARSRPCAASASPCRQGEIFGFLGPNGAGKTTTLRMLTTLLPIDAGTATVAGSRRRARAGEGARSEIGYVSQLGGADDLATGRENLMLQGRLYGGERARRRSARARSCSSCSTSRASPTVSVKTYSGGQRRRLDVALGIVHEPEVLFLDEPTTGLDPQNRANLWDHLRALARARRRPSSSRRTTSRRRTRSATA